MNRLTFLRLLVLLGLIGCLTAGCGGDGGADGDLPDGDTAVDGDSTVDGDTAADGDTAVDGDSIPDGDTTADGDGPLDGDAADGDTEPGYGSLYGRIFAPPSLRLRGVVLQLLAWDRDPLEPGVRNLRNMGFSFPNTSQESIEYEYTYLSEGEIWLNGFALANEGGQVLELGWLDFDQNPITIDLSAPETSDIPLDLYFIDNATTDGDAAVDGDQTIDGDGLEG